MATHIASSSSFGLDQSDAELFITRLVQASVPTDRLRDDELLNLADSLRLINDRLPETLQQHRLLARYWDRIEDEITLRLLDTLTNNDSGEIDGQLSIDDMCPDTIEETAGR